MSQVLYQSNIVGCSNAQSEERARSLTPPDLEAPRALRETGLKRAVLTDLLLKHLYRSGVCSTAALARRLALAPQVVASNIDLIRVGGLIEPFAGGSHEQEGRWGLTAMGRNRAAEALSRSSYVGPAPVSLEDYCRVVERDAESMRIPGPQALASRLSDTSVRSEQVEALGAALAARRLIFVWGPAGSGKTHLLKALSQALTHPVRIPYSIAIGEAILEVFDPRFHKPSMSDTERAVSADLRWVWCEPPSISPSNADLAVDFEIRHDPRTGRLHAPVQLKANHGLILIDDFASRRNDPHLEADRWRGMVDHDADVLMLPGGARFTIPWRGRLVLAASVAPERCGDESFVRRLSCRVELGPFSASEYRDFVFRLYRAHGHPCTDELVQSLIDRHRFLGLPLVPGTLARLVQIAIDRARYCGQIPDLGRDAIDRAWVVQRGLSVLANDRRAGHGARGTIATPQHRSPDGSTDVRHFKPSQPV